MQPYIYVQILVEYGIIKYTHTKYHAFYRINCDYCTIVATRFHDGRKFERRKIFGGKDEDWSAHDHHYKYYVYIVQQSISKFFFSIMFILNFES